jgi:hypothetical protein
MVVKIFIAYPILYLFSLTPYLFINTKMSSDMAIRYIYIDMKYFFLYRIDLSILMTFIDRDER